MASAVLPAPEGPKVQFEHDDAHPKAPSLGMGDVLGEALLALVNECRRWRVWANPKYRISWPMNMGDR